MVNWNGNKGRVCFWLCFQATACFNFSFLFVTTDKFTPTVAQGVLISLRQRQGQVWLKLSIYIFLAQIFKNSLHDSESLKYCVLFSTVWYVWCLRMLFVKWSEYEDIHWSWAHAGVRAKCWMTTEGWGSPDRWGHQVTHYCYKLHVTCTQHTQVRKPEWMNKAHWQPKDSSCLKWP